MIYGAPQALIDAIGWTLIHAIWQGTMAAAAVALLWAGLPRAKPNLRYAIACGGLLAVAVGGLVTFAAEIRQHIDQAPDIAPPLVSETLRDGHRAASAPNRSVGTPTTDSEPSIGRETLLAQAIGWRSVIRQGANRSHTTLRLWLPAIVVLWGIGVSVLSARLLLEWWLIRQVSASRRPIDDPEMVGCLRRIERRMGIGTPVGLFDSLSATVPFVLGWLKPAILLPAGLLTGLNAAELDAILAHELAHIRRRDYLVNLLQTVVETIYFYHPGVWWISRLVRQEREFCSDDLAAVACGDRVVYGRALLALEHWRGAPERLKVAANGGSLVERVRRLAGADAPRQFRPGAVFLSIVALLCTAWALVAVDGRAEPRDEAHQLDAPTVTVTTVQSKPVTLTQPYVCQISSYHRIEVRALQRGYLETITFKEGQQVKAGDPLFKVIPILYQKKAEAENAEAMLAKLELNGIKKLAENKVVSQDEVALLEAKLLKAQVKADLAKAELDFATVRAPFDGIVGRLQHQQGSLILEGEVLTTLSDNSVMWVYFNVPDARYLEFMQDQRKEDLKIELVLANGEKFDHAGKLGAIEANFNNGTGNIPFRADFPNPDRLLRHGQTGTVLINRVLNEAIVIPQRATFEVLNTRYVFVVDNEDVAHQREIVIQNQLDDLFVVKTGVSVNDKIVVEGVRRVRDGEKVEYEDHQPK